MFFSTTSARFEHMKSFLGNLKAWHESEHIYKGRYAERGVSDNDINCPSALHPIVRTHPETGKKALYVTEAFVKEIKDLDPKESQEKLEFLYSHASQEKYIYRHKWSKGDLIVWDNRSVQHFAEHGYGDNERTMHRLTTSGSKPY